MASLHGPSVRWGLCLGANAPRTKSSSLKIDRGKTACPSPHQPGVGRAERWLQNAAGNFPSPNSFAFKILSVSYCSPWIKFQFFANPMIPIDHRGGGGVAFIPGKPKRKTPCFAAKGQKRINVEMHPRQRSDLGDFRSRHFLSSP